MKKSKHIKVEYGESGSIQSHWFNTVRVAKAFAASVEGRVRYCLFVTKSEAVEPATTSTRRMSVAR